MKPNKKPINHTLRKYIYERDGKLCRFCKTQLKLFKSQVIYMSEFRVAHIDHIKPRIKGGSNSKSNLQLLCDICNMSKGGR